ncbi:MAG: hypothetical protein AB8H03_12155 [Saprospiraceae bacterium]
MIYTSSRYNLLQSFTSEVDLLEELFFYTQNNFFQNKSPFRFKKLKDEPQVAYWERYIEESKNHGVYQTLKKYLVQFQFPIKENISQTDDYKKATLKGNSTAFIQDATGLFLTEPDKLRLFLHPSLAGKIPVIIANNRFDFQAIVRALTYRNEPKPMPSSMGAAMIQGLNNWDRLRKETQTSSFQSVVANRALYQDRIIILSRIPYSNVGAEDMNLEQEDWLDRSLNIRLEHECAHYFTLRQFGKMSNNMHDEIIADFMGICSVLPEFSAKWFLKFIGLGDYPRFKKSGRMKNYLGDPPLSDAAFKILQTIVKQAADNIERFDKNIGQSINGKDRKFKLVALCLFNLTELASEDGVKLLSEAYYNLQENV